MDDHSLVRKAGESTWGMAPSKIPETIPESLGEKSTSDPITEAGCLGFLLG